MLKRLECMVSIFTKITTGVVFVTAVFIQIFYRGDIELGVEILWQDLVVSAVCTLPALLIPIEGEREVSKCSMLIRMIFYYCFVNVVVLSLGAYFSWFALSDWKQVLGMEVAIAIVFAFVMVVSYWAEHQTAERMNQKLKGRNR